MDIQKSFKGGGSFVKIQPKFSSCSEFIYIGFNNEILCYNVKTSKRVAKFLGLQSKIVDFSLYNYHNLYENIAACSVDGEVISWKLDTHFKLQQLKLGVENVENFKLISLDSGEIKALISYRNGNKIEFLLYDLQNNHRFNYNLKLICDDGGYSMDFGKNFWVVTQKNNLFLMKLLSGQVWKYNIGNGREFSCVKCHPCDEIILTGDNTGRVLMWQNLFNKKPTQAVFHWHTLPVNTIEFSTVGSCFYSGGEEAVLVKWNIENNDKSFLPRLSSTLKHITISKDNHYLSLSTDDNAIQIFDSQFKHIGTIQNLVIADEFGGASISWDSRTRALIMNGHTGHLQFYLPYDMELLYNLDVVGQNKITNERNCKMKNTQITKFAINKNGLWLATVEENHQLPDSMESRLKFWYFDSKQQIFKLNTSIETPHQFSITGIEFQPIELKEHLKLVTICSKEKCFKIWELVDATTIYKKSSAWRFYSNGFYRNLQCDDLSFSIDGSLIAINFDYFLTIWLPDSCELKSSLVHPEYKEKINIVEFGRGNQCHLIVTTSNNRLNVWNILTLSLIWTVPVNVYLLVKNPITTHMAIITTSQNLLIFSPESPQLIYESGNILKNHPKIISAAFVHNQFSSDVRLNWYQRSSLFFIDSNHELYAIGENIQSEFDGNNNNQDIDNSSIVDKINPKTKIGEESTKLEKLLHILPEQKNIKKFLEAPVHTMIPIRIICKSLLKSMIIQK